MTAELTEIKTVPKHPAKFSDAILQAVLPVLREEIAVIGAPITVLDPMAGVGRVHELHDFDDNIWTDGVELELEWANQHPRTKVGDATNLRTMFRPGQQFDVVLTSPPYGNRMADHHNAKERCRSCGGEGCEKCDGLGYRKHTRMTYKHKLGRDLSENSGAGLQWGDAYRELHKRILAEMVWVTKPGGLVVVNISNFFKTLKKGDPPVEQEVSEWWLAQMLLAGLELEKSIPVETPRMLFGANRTVRVECEWVHVTRKLGRD